MILARARCGSDERGRKVWMGEGYGRCLLCENGKDTWGHLAEECEGVKEEWVGAKGSGRVIEWMREDGAGVRTLEKLGRVRENSREC